MIPSGADIEAVKTAVVTDNAPAGLGINDLITYTITVTNTGNVVLENVSLVDTLVDLDGNPLALASGPDFVSADLGSSEGDLLVGETATYTATYVIDQDDVNAGGVSNSVVATGDDPDDNEVDDTSDDGDDTDGNDEDDPTDTIIPSGADIEAVKTAVVTDNAPAGLGLSLIHI